MAKAKEENFLREGIEVELSIGKFVIKEFSLKQINLLIKTFVQIFGLLREANQNAGEEEVGKFLLSNLDQPEVSEAVENLVCTALNKKKGEVDLTLSDGLKVLDAIIEVNDWGLIRDLFFKILQKVGGEIQKT